MLLLVLSSIKQRFSQTVLCLLYLLTINWIINILVAVIYHSYTFRSGENRANFSIAKFANKYNLGNPVAGNFYQAEWDEYCEVVYKQLSG